VCCDHPGAWFNLYVWPLIGLDHSIQEIDQIKPRPFMKIEACARPHINRIILFDLNQGLVSIVLHKYICRNDSKDLNEIHFASQDISYRFRDSFWLDRGASFY
jgi:hypothetical protein